MKVRSSVYGKLDGIAASPALRRGVERGEWRPLYTGVIRVPLPALMTGVIVERGGVAAERVPARRVVAGSGQRPALPANRYAVSTI
jgi:hypothetical protein